MKFFWHACTCKEVHDSDSQCKSLPKFNLRLLVTAWESVWLGLNTLVSLTSKRLHIGSITPFWTRKLIWKIQTVVEIIACINLQSQKHYKWFFITHNCITFLSAHNKLNNGCQNKLMRYQCRGHLSSWVI